VNNQIERRRFLVSGGLTLAADVDGDPEAPPVILLHGGGQTRHSWGGAMRELVAHRYFVLNLDARGHGESDWAPDGNYGFDVMAQDLRAVIATLPSAPALVGASMGGATALLAIGNADAPIARALVLVDIVPRVEQAGADRILSFMRSHSEGFANLASAAEAVAAYCPERVRPDDPQGLMKNLRLRDDGRLHWHWDPRILDRSRRLEPPQWVEALEAAAAHVRIPTLLIRGLRSDIVSDAGVVALKLQIPQLQVLNVSDAGHMVAGDRNDAFNRGVIAFVQNQLAPG
jgi:pimeloyl-ACP methyl ester carboxylesterase